METSLASFVGSFLQCVLGKTPTQQQIEMLMAVARRADFERLTRGDFVIPLKSPKLKEVADPATVFGRFLLNPTQENIKHVERALEACKLPVANISVHNSMLRIHLDKDKVMKTFIPRIAKEGMKYGASKLLLQVPVIVNHCMTDTTNNSSLRNMRGLKLANHISKILVLCGAKVKMRKNNGAKSKDEDFTMVDKEDCEQQLTQLVTAEPHNYSPEQSTDRGTSLAPAYYSVMRECDWGMAECTQDTETRQKKLHIEANCDVLCNRQREIDSVVPDTTDGKKYVTCAPQNQSTATDTQTLKSRVRERVELPVKDEKTVSQKEPTSLSSQDATDEQKNELVSEIEFMITDSLKGIENGPWVYRYGGVVHAKTGNPWIGSLNDYYRLVFEELKEASEMRQKEDGLDYMAFLEEQAQRCLTLQLVSPTHSNQLRVEVDGDTCNTKESSFMLYNYARLCSIFHHFEQCVQQGEVAPLPPAEDVDFSLLRHDEEWDLVWVYLLRWPEIIEETALGVLGRSRKLKTAHVSRFLHTLCHRCSEYYSRYQVLSEGFLPHLLPLMYARLHLLQALSTLMRVCFDILGVDSPPSHM